MKTYEKRLRRTLTYLIGRLTIEHSCLEYEVKWGSTSFLDSDIRKSFMAVSQLNLRQSCELFIGLYELWEEREERLDQARKILGQAVKAAERRNPLIHGNWTVINDFIGLHGHEKPRKGKHFQVTFQETKLHEIRDVINEINKARKNLEAFYDLISLDAYLKEHPEEKLRIQQ